MEVEGKACKVSIGANGINLFLRHQKHNLMVFQVTQVLGILGLLGSQILTPRRHGNVRVLAAGI